MPTIRRPVSLDKKLSRLFAEQLCGGANPSRDSMKKYTKEERNTWQKNQYNNRKEKAITFLGGKCIKCNSAEDLQFDHKNPKDKKFNISIHLVSLSWGNLVKELIKCQLLCRNCHIEKSILESGKQLAKGTHGTVSSYRYCRCDICNNYHNQYQREHYKRYMKNRKRVTINGKRIIIKNGDVA